MTVSELIAALSGYAKTHPENGSAEVVFCGLDNESCFHLGRALDGKGYPGQHYLVFIADPQKSFKMRDARAVN